MLLRLNSLARTGLLVAVLVATVLVIAVGISIVVHKKDGERKSTALTPSVTVDQWRALTQENQPGDIAFLIHYYVSAVDSRAYNIKIAASAYVLTVFGIVKIISGQEFNENDFVDTRAPFPFNLTLGDKENLFQESALLSRQEIPIPILEGMPMNYPVDDYRTEFFMAASTTINNTFYRIPIAALTFSALPLFSFRTNFTYNPNSNSALVARINIKRSRLVIGYSIVVIIIMWLLSLSLFTLAVGVWVRKRKVEPPTIAFSVAMLFAIPNVRNAQPGIGEIGALGDVAGYFWNMMLIVASDLRMHLSFTILGSAAAWLYECGKKGERERRSGITRQRQGGPPPDSMLANDNSASGVMSAKAASFQKKNPPPEPPELDNKQVKEIEKQFEKRGHSAWAFAKPSGFSFKSYVTISNSFNIKFRARPAGYEDTELAILSSMPMYKDPANQDRQFFYYECTVVDLAEVPKTTVIGVGVATSPYPSFRLVGWQDYSVGYHSDDGRVFVNDAFAGKGFGSPFTTGDTVGVGYDPVRGTVFFTLNGLFLSDATSEQYHPYHAALSADGACELEINFGQKPFTYEPANPGWNPDKAVPIAPPPTTTPSTLNSTAPTTSDVVSFGE
ncbi:Rsp5p-dependent ubiquitination, sorting of cargo proteins at the multivesicular body, partial [Quaeritorhiza haematococci]